MQILVTAPGEFVGDGLVVGKYYQVEETDEGTDRQNRTLHALLQEYWRSGCHSYNAKSFPHFRELIKIYLGAVAEKYYSLVDDKGKLVDEPIVRYRVKSWTRYSKKERTETIDRVIAEMEQVGVQTKKFYEILEGMEERSLERMGA